MTYIRRRHPADEKSLVKRDSCEAWRVKERVVAFGRLRGMRCRLCEHEWRVDAEWLERFDEGNELPLPPTPANEAGGQTDGRNSPNTPWVEDTGPAPYADGPAEQLNDYEFLYTVTENDTVLAIASRFRVQTMDVIRVNFPCRDPLNVQPRDVLHIRWPQPYEVVGIGEGC